MPSGLRGPFNELCEIAFKGTCENKVTFSESDLKAVKHSAVIREMGLLQATSSIVSNGEVAYYNFAHLSVQEVLTSVYISRLPAGQQISTFDRLFGDSRFGPVLQHYAAITKLCTSRPKLSKLPSWLIPKSITVHMSDLVRRIIAKKNKPLLVSLLHCLYEAQDVSLFKFVIEQLEGSLELRHTSLSPVDCLAIGYFLFFVTVSAGNNKSFTVDLYNCSLGDAGTKSLMRTISRQCHIDSNSTVKTPLDMELQSNDIREEGASHIARLLNNTSMVSGLTLLNNPIGDKGLQTIFNSLKLNTTLKVLTVSYCGMTDAGVPSLAEAMNINRTLERFDFLRQHTSVNIIVVSLLHCFYESQVPSLFQFVAEQLQGRINLRDTSVSPVDCFAIGYFLSCVTVTASAMKVFKVDLDTCSLGDAGTKSLMCSIRRHIGPHTTVNTHLDIRLGRNEIHEDGASQIAEILNNTSITSELWLGCNPIGDKGLRNIFNGLKQNNTLKILDISYCSMTNAIVSSLTEAMNINKTLKRLDISGNPIICDKGLRLIFDSLKLNNTLKVLNVSFCGMTDAGVPSLAEAMDINTTLKRLDIFGNDAITVNGLTCLVEVLSTSSKLMRLWIPKHLKVDEVRKTINEARGSRELKAIKVNCRK